MRHFFTPPFLYEFKKYLRENIFDVFLKDFIYLLLRERDREHKQGEEAEGEGEAGSPSSRELDMGLDFRALGS